MTSDSFAKAYDPGQAEQRWYRYWEDQGFFNASTKEDETRPSYTIAIPPPNVTGFLHMGHACRATFEDLLIRYHRMRGYNTMWIPGTDHAGIATQVVVERQLKSEGKTRHDLGRDAFIERVWEWKKQSGDRILQQLRSLGASCDWSRQRFTMDPDLSKAVTEAFIRLHNEGLIYRGSRLVNWDVQTQTVLSDLEVETEENVQGEMFDFAYPIGEEDGGGEIVVSTTRPETMLGDTAVAVHPDDPRYKHLHGKAVNHPFVSRKIPIITDPELVDPEFGTGVVKVTPAHDPNDFATGKRHKLEEINIFNLDGSLNEQGGPFQGMDRFVARKAVKKALDEKGLARGTKKHSMTLPRSQRSGTIVEPMISTQWFVKMETLAKPALDAVRDGETVFIPEDWTKTYNHWLENIQDWCISRQLWWGHQIPAYHCDGCEHIQVAREKPAVCERCQGKALTQDPDVLDTWFSSALWPFSTLGWPKETEELKRFYPTSDMETGYDIIFFWVARMMMLGIHFMGKVPFRRVMLAGMVTDERGQKMSKVKGNVVDPLDVINGATLETLLEKAQRNGTAESGIKYLKKTYPEGFQAHGADALRYTLLSYSPRTRKIPLSISRVEGYRNFCNKLWNAARFATMNLEGFDSKDFALPKAPKALANRWILARLHNAIDAANKGIGQYRLDEASKALYHFTWHELCDWYLELSKDLLQGEHAEETKQTLAYTLEKTLRLLHPMMPFITEEIWHKVPRPSDAPSSIMIAAFPELKDARADEGACKTMNVLQQIITATRTIRAEHEIPRSKPVPLTLRSPNQETCAIIEQQKTSIETLCRAVLTTEHSQSQESPENTAVSLTDAAMVIVPLSGLVDPKKEQTRLERELNKARKDLESVERNLQTKAL